MDAKRPTIRDVATAANVSGSTVSRYLNGTLDLREDTARRIDEAIAQIGYRLHGQTDGNPKTNGRSEGNSTTQSSAPLHLGTLGMIVPAELNSYFARMVQEVAQAGQRVGYEVVVSLAFDQQPRRIMHVELFERLNVDGLIYIGTAYANPTLNRAVKDGLPVVVINDEQTGLDGVDVVVHDDYAGAFQATSHLVRLGHRKIAAVLGTEALGSQRERMRGYRDALLRAGIEPDLQLVVRGEFTESAGASALPRILAEDPASTAVFVSNDVVAMGLLGVARSMAVDVPGQLSVAGFADAPTSRHLNPPLTTAHVSLREMARSAVDLMLQRLADPTRAPTTITVPASLVERASAAPLVDPVGEAVP